MFLSADAIYMTLDNVVSGLVVYPSRIYSHLMEELPFQVTENIIMKLVSLGKLRQDAHEETRVLSHQASDVVKNEGKKIDLIERIKKTEFFKPVWEEIDALLDPMNFIGRRPEQVLKFCGDGGEVQEALKPYKKFIDESEDVELHVRMGWFSNILRIYHQTLVFEKYLREERQNFAKAQPFLLFQHSVLSREAGIISQAQTQNSQ